MIFQPSPFFIQQTQRILKSYTHWTKQTLIPSTSVQEVSRLLFTAPFVLVSHGVEADPILNYGNQAALDLWEMTWEDFIRTPSRLTAETPNQEMRAKVLNEVTQKGFIEGYEGIRISRTGRRFKIQDATIWNLQDEQGQYCGQAAMFRAWRFLY